SQSVQSKPAGMGGVSVGRVGNWGHMGRIDQLWISRSVPIAPFLIISTACFWLAPSLAGMKWVAIFFVRAMSMTALASSRRFARGFWAITFIPFFNAAVDIGG